MTKGTKEDRIRLGRERRLYCPHGLVERLRASQVTRMFAEREGIGLEDAVNLRIADAYGELMSIAGGERHPLCA